MFNCRRLILLCCLILSTLDAHGQIDSIRQQYSKTKIALKDIIGNWNWQHSDSSIQRLSFVNNKNQSVSIPEIRHGAGQYTFFIIKDSVEVNGSAANWPPYYCTIKQLDKNSIELLFYNVQFQGVTVISCRREKE